MGRGYTWIGALLLGACLVMLWRCDDGSIGTVPCSDDAPCSPGSWCSDAGVCVPVDGGGEGGGDLALFPDGGCQTVLCGQPAVCCKVGEECVDGQCLPECQSGVRCLGPPVVCCNSGEVCLSGTCTAPGKACQDSFDCAEGEFCEPTLGKCLPQPSGTKCEVKPQNVTFQPTVEWSWSGYSKDTTFHEVVVSPAVADIDADGTPEVVFTAYNHSDSAKGMLVVLDGATGKEELTLPYTSHNMSAWCGVALGNLDSDNELEIVAIVRTKGVVVFEHDGTEKWANATGSLAQAAAPSVYPHPALADLDADGTPEIVVGGVVLNAAGTVLFDKGMIGKNGQWVLSTAADLDEDGKLEVIGGNVVYDATGAVVWQSTQPDGLAAAADIDLDGLGDVVVVSSGQVRVHAGKDGKVIFGPVAIPGGGSGGPPTVGDFDGDGRPEFSAAGQGKYAVYDPDCKAGGNAAHCPSGSTDGILWSVTTQDISSSVTGSSLFDFQGDGTVEVVYNDECHLYVLDGKTGTKLMTLENTSRTAIEFPLIADVDGDNNSEFVVPSNDDKIVRDNCKPPGTRGIRVFGDSADKWVRTRAVWNQHTYHVTNVGSGGQIPQKEERNWDKAGLNNFRQNVQGEGVFNAPDLVASLEVKTTGCPKSLELRARVTNAGSLGVKAGISVAFYLGSPGSASTLVGTTATTQSLLPGASELVSVSYSLPADNLGPFDFWVGVDDDGTGAGAETECREDNNTAVITGVSCPMIR